MAVEKIKMSQEQYDKFQAELNYLETERTREVAEQLKEARSFGDLSENSEYDEAKSEQGKLYSKIAEIHNLLENAEIVEAAAMEQGVIGLGSKVVICEVGESDEEAYEIVGSQEADPMHGKLSNESPIGRALQGHKAGETITAELPTGAKIQFNVVSVD